VQSISYNLPGHPYLMAAYAALSKMSVMNEYLTHKAHYLRGGETRDTVFAAAGGDWVRCRVPAVCPGAACIPGSEAPRCSFGSGTHAVAMAQAGSARAAACQVKP
jgi:hypothetical protein